jgi:hypothetical protein
MIKTKRELVGTLDVVKEIIRNQPTGIEIEITIYEALVEIKGDKTYALASLERSTRLLIDGDVVRDDIKPLPKKGITSGIESFVYGSIYEFEMARKCEDMMTGRVVFVLKRK